jgi:hypothetical protein
MGKKSRIVLSQDAEWEERHAKLRKALTDIIERGGHACKDYETCGHESCGDSAYAWVRAGEALYEDNEYLPR